MSEIVEPKKDWSKENPGLHMLYVKWAFRHLVLIDRMIKMFFEISNTNTAQTAEVLLKHRSMLLRNDQAYRDADDFIQLQDPNLSKDQDSYFTEGNDNGNQE